MKKVLIFLSAILCLCVLLCACGDKPTTSQEDTQTQQDTALDTKDEAGDPAPKEFTINSIHNYNIESETDSHKDDWKRSHLELSYRDRIIVDSSTTTTKEVWYPRIKLCANGEYIMLFMNGQTGNHIYISYSKDLKSWYGTKRLFEGKASPANSPIYASADAIVLKNGDIIAAAGYRGFSTYSKDVTTDGIQIRRSTDNGVTWSALQTVYRGGVWEPSLLQLESGEVQMYWTNTHIKGAPTDQLGRADDNSTGTAMIRSFDNGVTWNNDPNKLYDAQIVAQQFTKKGSDGNYYSGQMPVAWQLNSGDIVLAMELRTLDSKNEKTYHMSFAYSKGENSWPDSLGLDEEGPSNLKKNPILKAAGPYIRQFKSGETLLTYHWGADWFMLMGNNSATEFLNDKRMESFGPDVKTSIWGSTELIGTHTVIGTVPSSDKGSIYVGKFILNHTIDAKKASINADGDLSEWSEIDQAIFVGSESQAQASIRVSQDDNNVYFTAEVLDYFVSSDDKINFLIGNSSTGKYCNFGVSAGGKISINKGGIKIAKENIQASVAINGTADEFKDRDKGYVIEVCIPKSVFGADTLVFCPVMYNKDSADGKLESDSIGNMSTSDASEWPLIKLG